MSRIRNLSICAIAALACAEGELPEDAPGQVSLAASTVNAPTVNAPTVNGTGLSGPGLAAPPTDPAISASTLGGTAIGISTLQGLVVAGSTVLAPGKADPLITGLASDGSGETELVLPLEPLWVSSSAAQEHGALALGTDSEWRYYGPYHVPDAASLTAELTLGSGHSVFVRRCAAPTETTYDCRAKDRCAVASLPAVACGAAWSDGISRTPFWIGVRAGSSTMRLYDLEVRGPSNTKMPIGGGFYDPVANGGADTRLEHPLGRWAPGVRLETIVSDGRPTSGRVTGLASGMRLMPVGRPDLRVEIGAGGTVSPTGGDFSVTTVPQRGAAPRAIGLWTYEAWLWKQTAAGAWKRFRFCPNPAGRALLTPGHLHGGTVVKGTERGFFNLSCPGATLQETSAVAKCVQWLGYVPGLNEDHRRTHAACVQTLRANYAGEGVSWTRTGEDIDLWDDLLGALKNDPNLAWGYDAAYDELGAITVSKGRLGSTYCNVNYTIPPNVTVPTCVDGAGRPGLTLCQRVLYWRELGLPETRVGAQAEGYCAYLRDVRCTWTPSSGSGSVAPGGSGGQLSCSLVDSYGDPLSNPAYTAITENEAWSIKH